MLTSKNFTGTICIIYSQLKAKKYVNKKNLPAQEEEKKENPRIQVKNENKRRTKCHKEKA